MLSTCVIAKPTTRTYSLPRTARHNPPNLLNIGNVVYGSAITHERLEREKYERLDHEKQIKHEKKKSARRQKRECEKIERDKQVREEQIAQRQKQENTERIQREWKHEEQMHERIERANHEKIERERERIESERIERHNRERIERHNRERIERAKQIKPEGIECAENTENKTFTVGHYYAHAVDNVYYRCILLIIDTSDKYSYKIKYMDKRATAQNFREGWIKPSKLMPEYLMGSRVSKPSNTKKKSNNIQTPEDFRAWLATHNMVKIPLRQTMIKMGVVSSVQKLGGSNKLSKILNIPMVYTRSISKKRKRGPPNNTQTKKRKVIQQRKRYRQFEKEFLMNMSQIDNNDERATALNAMVLRWNNNA